MLLGRGHILLGRNTKYSIEEKLNVINEYQNGRSSINAIAQRLEVSWSIVNRWIKNYEAMGMSAFTTTCNKRYSPKDKEQAVCEYLAGKGSLGEICKKYKIRSDSQLRNWIKKYNSHEGQKSFKPGETTIMTKGRTTTFGERVEIASFCIAHNHNYIEASEQFQVSYQQARNYTIKYEQFGINGLQDNRGKRKSEDSLSEIEKLKAELKLEKAKRLKAEMEASFLKKLDEIERRRG